MAEKKSNSLIKFEDERGQVSILELRARESICLFLYLAGLLIFASFMDISLGSSPDDASIIQAKAPWVFGAIQFLLYHWPAWVSGWLFPIISFILLLGYPWLSIRITRVWARVIFVLFTGVWVLLTVLYIFIH